MNEVGSLPERPQHLIAEKDKLAEFLDQVELTPANQFQLLDTIYASVNRYNVFVKTFAVCEEGSYCCKIGVTVSHVEAAIYQYQGWIYFRSKS